MEKCKDLVKKEMEFCKQTSIMHKNVKNRL